MIEQDVYSLACKLGQLLDANKVMCAVAESCTGGYLSKLITDVQGSSAWFDRGFITYSNNAKQEMLGVRAATLEKFGAVSCETAREMAAGVLTHSNAQISVAITGIAGPDGGSLDKPVGTVCFAWAVVDGECSHELTRFKGRREDVRLQATAYALSRLLSVLKRYCNSDI